MQHPLIDDHLQQSYDCSDEALQARGKELENESNSTRLSSDILVAIRHDLDHQPSDTIACPVWGLAPGSITAIRQYIASHIREGVLYATSGRENLEQMFYDLVALGVPPIAISIMDETNADPCRPIVLTTHHALISPRPGYRLAFQRKRHCIIDEGLQLYKLAWKTHIADIERGLIGEQQTTPIADQIGYRLREYEFPYVFLIDMTSVLFYGESPLFRIYRS